MPPKKRTTNDKDGSGPPPMEEPILEEINSGFVQRAVEHLEGNPSRDDVEIESYGSHATEIDSKLEVLTTMVGSLFKLNEEATKKNEENNQKMTEQINGQIERISSLMFATQAEVERLKIQAGKDAEVSHKQQLNVCKFPEKEGNSGNHQAGENRRLENVVCVNGGGRYTPPHKRDEEIGSRHLERQKATGKGLLQSAFAVTNPNTMPKAYEEISQVFPVADARGATTYHQLLPRLPMIDHEVIRDMVQDLYGPGIRPMNRPEFHKPYPEIIDVNNPYPRGFRVPDFALFSGENDQSTIEHVARFTIQCGELANQDNFTYLKLRMFPNSLTGTAFKWYAQLPRNSINSWQEMERLFHTQFFKSEPEICVAELSRLSQKSGESTNVFIERFKRLKSRCKVFLPEMEFVKMAQRGLDFELRKKFQGTEFRDFYEMAAKVADYEELLREESYRKKSTIGSYFQEVEDVSLAEVGNTGSYTCPSLKKKSDEVVKKNILHNQGSNQFTFDVSKTEDIFDFLVKEKFITFPQDHQMPKKEELKGRDYCKFHNSFNHPTNACWAFRNIVQDRITKGVLKFPEKKESMVIDEDPFPPVATVNVNTTDLRTIITQRRESMIRGRGGYKRTMKRCWIPKNVLHEIEGQVMEGSSRGRHWYNNRMPKETMAYRPGSQWHRRGSYSGGSSQWYGREMMLREPGNPANDQSIINQNYGSMAPRWEGRFHAFAPRPRNNTYVRRGMQERDPNVNDIRPRFIRPPNVEPDGKWQKVQHKKFPQPPTRTQKRRILREKAAQKREETIAGSKGKNKFGRLATEDKDFEDDDLLSDEEVKEAKKIDFRVGKFHISVDCNTGSVILPDVFKLKEDVKNSEKLEEIKSKADDCYAGVTIQEKKSG